LIFKINGTKLNVKVEGEGIPIILIHGVGADLTLWDDVVPILSKSYKIIRYDLRGCGLSELSSEPSLEILAEDLAGIMDALSIRDAHVLGWSLGGMIAIQFTSIYPDRVKSLILVGTNVRLGSRAAAIFQDRVLIARQEGMEALVNRTFQFTEQTFSPEVREKNPEKVARFKSKLLRNSKEGYAACAEVLLRSDVSKIVPGIKNPTLVIAGQHDTSSPISGSEELCIYLENSLMKIIPNCGHYYPLEQPELLIDALKLYLGLLGSR
jgi:3-oxoadipate enol-lactonase